MATPGLQLGAPGVYPAPRVLEPAFQPVRLDVAGFVGVALRGPVDTPVLVTSWTDYLRRFGGFAAPVGAFGPDRLLPYGVQAFFEQGGVRAYVVRVAPPYDGPGEEDPAADAATTRFEVGPLELRAADEGSWGDRLRVRLEYDVGERFLSEVTVPGEVPVPAGVAFPAGTLLRLRGQGLAPEGALRWADAPTVRVDDRGRPRRVAVLTPEDGSGVDDDPTLAARDEPLEVAVVTGAVVADDPDPELARSERVAGLGLHPAHPRWLGGPVLDLESVLLTTAGAVPDPLLPDDPLLGPVAGRLTGHGADRWDRVSGRSFFDDEPAGSDPLDESPHRGVDALSRVPEVALVCAPDLTWSWKGSGAVVEEPPRPRPQPGFGPCRVEQVPVTYAVAAPSAHLDGRFELDEIIARQERLVALADLRRRFVALLDVPVEIPTAATARWRARFDSAYAAAYHPWLGVPRRDGPGLVLSPPSAFAAGITAARERRLGLPWGPANELAQGAVTLGDPVTDAVHDDLHRSGVNVFRAERDGFRLTAARTLSGDPQYRQLSVRRLMTMLALTLDRQSQWIVFEPHTVALRDQLVHAITMLLRGLQRQGAFAGATEEESFFVRCDDELNPPANQGLGQLVALVGVAPAEPLEYLVLRITQDAEGHVEVVAEDG